MDSNKMNIIRIFSSISHLTGINVVVWNYSLNEIFVTMPKISYFRLMKNVAQGKSSPWTFFVLRHHIELYGLRSDINSRCSQRYIRFPSVTYVAKLTSNGFLSEPSWNRIHFEYILNHMISHNLIWNVSVMFYKVHTFIQSSNFCH